MGVGEKAKDGEFGYYAGNWQDSQARKGSCDGALQYVIECCRHCKRSNGA